MPGRGAALENLDDDHASAAAWARVREGGRLVAIIIIGICSLALGPLATEQLAGACDVVGAGSLGEQAVVSDAVEALRQDMDEEAADELVCCERHHDPSRYCPYISPSRHLARSALPRERFRSMPSGH